MKTFIRRTCWLSSVLGACLVSWWLVPGCELLPEEGSGNELSNPVYRIFEGRLTYPVGESPLEVLVGDINRDGLRDLASLNWSEETVSILLARAGGYAAAVSYPVGSTPRAGVLADVTGNGFLDLAVVNESLDQITLLFGSGNGEFTETQILYLPEGAFPQAIRAVDLNGDGLVDLVTANAGSDSISILVGAGGGVFSDAVSFSAGRQPSGLWVGPLFNDGVAEIVVSNLGSNTLSVFEYNGVTYVETLLIPCGNGPRYIAAADLNRNGHLDLLVNNLNSGDISILSGLGNRQFSAETRFEMPGPVARFVVADFNGNTIPDLAALLFDQLGDNRQPASLFCIATGDGSGGFQNTATYGAGWGAISIAAADMSGNTRTDIVTADALSNTVSIAYNRGDATFQSDRRFSVGRRPGPAVLADFSNNGLSDLAVANREGNSISLFAGVGNGSFRPLTPLMLPAAPLALAAGDVNGDGIPDLIVSLNQYYTIGVFTGIGNGAFQAPRYFNILGNTQGPMPQVRSIALGDMDNDGYVDLITGNTSRDSVSVLFNDGTGRFSNAIVTWVGNYPLSVHVADINRDGNLDIVFLSTKDPDVATDNADPRVVRWFGNGDGTFDFDSHTRFATGGGPIAMAMADVTGNGRLDAITVHPGGNSLYLLEGVSNVSFSPGVKIPIGKTPVSVALAQVRRDGKSDLICGLNVGSAVVRLSRGGGAFEGSNNFIVYPGVATVLVADLNRDTYPDLITVNASSNDIAVLHGRQFP